jgi:hypothetical protein
MAADTPSAQSPELRNTALSDALQIGDLAAVAFALRHGPTVVPGIAADQSEDWMDVGDVWTYTDPRTGDRALLLFSDADHMPQALPSEVALQSPAWLRAYLAEHQADIKNVFFDIAGPHPMRATPVDLIAALDA